MNKVAFLGGGSFSTALANLLAEKGNKINIWARSRATVDDINNNRKNSKYIKDLELNHNITAYESIEEALKGCNYVVIGTSSQAVREVSRKASNFIEKDAVVISIAKGIEEGTYKRLSEVIEEELLNPVVILSGPSHAEEVVKCIPTTVVSVSKNLEVSEDVQELFMTPYFRVYTNEDLIGVEIGGAVKNIIAFAAGVCDGIGYGDNAKAALMTRGMSEIVRIGEALGGYKETFFGLTGMGDLIVTCTSMHSRNRRAGILIGSGKSLDEAVEEIGMVVEGVKACKAFYNLKEKLDISMPITDVLYKVIFEGKKPKDGVLELMQRDKKSEKFLV